MEYLLKTSNTCNNNCTYCDYLKKKTKKKKTFSEIKKEILMVAKKNFSVIKVACNTDSRPDFLNILKFIKDNDLKIILETNGRIFSHKSYILRIDKYINKYEVIFSSPSKELSKFINKIDDGYFEQSIIGIKNIINTINDNNKLTVKTVILNENLANLNLLIDTLSILNVGQIKFIYPFKLKKEDSTPSMSWVSKTMGSVKTYASQKGIKVIIGDKLEYNPYVTSSNFLDINSAKLKKEFKINNKAPYFSIVIPTYDRTKLLKLVLESFFAQNFEKKDYEIIIVDDGGKESTEKMIKKLKPTCNLKYIYWPRKKIACKFNYSEYAKFYNRAGLTRNIGINYSLGKVLLFNDDDTLVGGNCLKKHNEYHKKYNDMIVRGFRMRLPDTFKATKENTNNFDDLYKKAKPEETLKTRTKNCRLYDLNEEGWKRVISSNLSLKKESLKKIGLFNNDSPFWGYEDVEFGYRAKIAGLKLMWDDNIKIFHMPHKKQTGNTYQTMATFWINTNIFYRKYFDEEIYELYKAVIMRRLDKNTLLNK